MKAFLSLLFFVGVALVFRGLLEIIPRWRARIREKRRDRGESV
jgi:hypothetical protein